MRCCIYYLHGISVTKPSIPVSLNVEYYFNYLYNEGNEADII